MNDGYCTCYPVHTADCGVESHRSAALGRTAPTRWRIFKCHCDDRCGSWWIGKLGSVAVAEFHSGAEALAAFARGDR